MCVGRAGEEKVRKIASNRPHRVEVTIRALACTLSKMDNHFGQMHSDFGTENLL